MFKTLYGKLLVILLLTFIVLSVLSISVTYFATNLYQQEMMQKLNAQVAEHIVKETEILKNGQVNHVALKKLFHSLMVLNPNLEIYLLDNEGGILAYSAPSWKVVRMSVDVNPIKQFLSGKQRFPLRGEDPRNHNREKIFSAATVALEEEPFGYLYVILGGEEFDSIADRIQSSYILSSSLIVTGCGLLLMFFFNLGLIKNITARLKKLSTSVKNFENKPQNYPSFPNTKLQTDEIGQLTAAFKTMALKIHRQLGDLQETDQLRRELVANVSHDLRTPLATLQGYVETLLIKQHELSEHEKHAYLKTAIKHCSTLNKLVSELFELARLDSCETKLKKEVFNLAELIEDITQKFALSCEKKNISLLTEYSENFLYINADIGLMERVLENLIENAIRYVPQDGTIKISLLADEHTVSINVCDTGKGIPETEIPYIFDRFYQLEKSRSVESGSSGLGLAIVKKIVELHESMIHVTSQPGVHTTFSFALPLSESQ